MQMLQVCPTRVVCPLNLYVEDTSYVRKCKAGLTRAVVIEHPSLLRRNGLPRSLKHPFHWLRLKCAAGKCPCASQRTLLADRRSLEIPGRILGCAMRPETRYY
ncbi:hypothetical protein PAXRUDRAFT_299996 [Paxillus rubicundulus Ve08.2h10]|uniref:Uncharacterized protein n=1 Tax=Paxillus rubicundulus Ve08.2h10 TaxID=930991 RepID=A0A0D0DSN1_9AGAM|nr:hypothetical protein PAXRUDRAFT_299996 [Paxillus rubicundulus Ve08.2h10]